MHDLPFFSYSKVCVSHLVKWLSNFEKLGIQASIINQMLHSSVLLLHNGQEKDLIVYLSSSLQEISV